jgi:hypothetical protein
MVTMTYSSCHKSLFRTPYTKNLCAVRLGPWNTARCVRVMEGNPTTRVQMSLIWKFMIA